MNGTRHEKAALISVAYFIGALTAFIWYGTSQTADLSLIGVDQGQSASVINATTKVGAVTPEREGIALYHDGVLDVEAIGGTKVLSFNPEVSGYTSSPEFELQGAHVGEVTYAVSPTEEYVFFCEQKSLAVNTCTPLIYDVLQDVIHSLSAESGAFDLTIAAAKSATWSAQGLSFDGGVSTAPNTPWIVNLN